MSKPHDAGMQAVAEGEAILCATQERYGFTDEASDGPLMRRWLRGELPAHETQPEIIVDCFLADRIAAVNEAERAGRTLVAAMGLAKLREQFDSFDVRDLPADERTWTEFCTKHFNFGLARANELIGMMLHRGALLRCTECGAGATCACACGVPYEVEHPWAPAKVPAIDRAMAALAANPEKSDRAIAADINVDHRTVAKARRALANRRNAEAAGHSPLDSPVERVGRDGRRRRASRPRRHR